MTSPPPGLDRPLVDGIPASLVGPLWRFVRDHLDRRRRNGAAVRPGETAFRDALRAAYLAQLQASGHPLPGSPDISPSSDHRTRTGPDLIRTDDLAARMGVTPRHARRTARAAGYSQPRRGWWRTEDAAALVEVARARR